MIGSWAGTKVTLAPVRFSNSVSTCLKFFCSSPVHTAAISTDLPFSFGSLTEDAGVLSPFPSDVPLLSSPPQAVSVSAREPMAMPTRVVRKVWVPRVLRALGVRVRKVLRVLPITAPFSS